MFKTELTELIDKEHPLCKLTHTIQWETFDEAFTPLFCTNNGRLGIRTRLVVALHYLKYTYDLSDEETVYRWVENPYWQYFSGKRYFQYELPINPSSMVKWRKKAAIHFFCLLR